MAYQAPSFGPAGLTTPSYQDILDDMIASVKNIWGQNIYLGNDSALYQLLSVFALKGADIMGALQLSVASRSPAFAIGAALDTLVKLNGMIRKSASFSSCVVTITGTPGTVINNGIVEDVNGVRWDLPAQVTIGGSGTIAVTAICETAGNVGAQPGDIATIATPTAGWTAVTNAGAAVPGQPVETDSQLRARQALSVALPSITMLAGTIAAIAAVPGVTRYNVVENPTGATDGLGNPPHSITAVVEGGADADIAQAIYNNRGIGCLTNGTTVIQVTDPNNGGVVMNIAFDRPIGVQIYVTVNVHALAGYSSAVTAAIQNAVASYINSLQIGESVTIGGLWYAVMTANPNPANPLFSLRQLFAGNAPAPGNSTNDLGILFNQVAQGSTVNVVVNLV